MSDKIIVRLVGGPGHGQEVKYDGLLPVIRYAEQPLLSAFVGGPESDMTTAMNVCEYRIEKFIEGKETFHFGFPTYETGRSKLQILWSFARQVNIIHSQGD